MDRVIEKKKGLKKKHIGYIVLGLFLVVIIYAAFFTDHTSTLRVYKDRLVIEEVKYGTFDDYTTINGQVEPIATIYLDVEEGGRVEEKLIEEGSMVKKGDVIIRLSNPDLRMRILDSEAQLAEKSNMLRNTRVAMEQERLQIKRQILTSTFDITKLRRAYERNRVLYDEELISEEEYLSSKENFELEEQSYRLFMERQKSDSIFRTVQVLTMEDNLENMRRNLEMVRMREENLNVKAPVNGQLGTLQAEVGESIQRGQRIGQVNVLTSHRVTALIDEHYIDRVKAGLLAHFERNGTEYELKVRRVYPQVRDNRFEVDMIFTGEVPDNIRTGQSYHIELQLGASQEATLIRKGGFFQTTGGQWIFVVDPSGEFATKREIRLGEQNPMYYEILEGLQPGEKVIVSNYDSFGKNEKLVFK
ncbi:MAG: HlyD family efflux transporter periplasmic adaptor subunit [Marinilabiliaceae bacterium]|jgi:HlyD family secretion protein|nr:HlyD family efflux transporter periplasmic adaptor subunit [Marinilabiliaceae bacterium]